MHIYSFFIAPIFLAIIYLHIFILFFIAPIYSDFIYLDVSNLFLFGCRMAARLSLTQDKGTLPPACAA